MLIHIMSAAKTMLSQERVSGTKENTLVEYEELKGKQELG
jgi:hypothetical protein